MRGICYMAANICYNYILHIKKKVRIFAANIQQTICAGTLRHMLLSSRPNATACLFRLTS